MIDGPRLYGFLLLLSLPAAGWLLSLSWDKRNKPGGRWLSLTLVGLAGWSVCWALVLLLGRQSLSLVSLNAVLLFVNLSVIGWFMLALEFTRQKRFRLRYVLPLFVVPAITQLLAITNQWHAFLWGPELILEGTGLFYLDRGPWFYAHTSFNYLLIVVSGGLVVSDYLSLDGIYRKQSAVLVTGWSLPVITSVAYNFGVFQTGYLNPTPVGFLAGAAIWGWGQYRFHLLEIAPIARRRALREMDEAVIAVNEDGLVAYLNEAAAAMFDVDPDATGEPLAELLRAYPDVLECVSEDVSNEEVVLTREDRRQYLSVTRTALTPSGGSDGSVIVCKDVSEVKRHERDLELLKQVFARVFRHDLSNDLNVIRAHGELLAANIDGPNVEYAETIVRTCDDVIETSRKARAIEKLVDADRDRYEADLVHVVREVVEWAERNFEAATIETRLPRDAFVLADRELELAVNCLVENAIVHNDSETPWVRITVVRRPDEVVLTVEDDGPGIAPNERNVFEQRHVDQLTHSNGLGLWTVNWVVRNSGGHATFDVTDDGTCFELRLQRTHSRGPARARIDR